MQTVRQLNALRMATRKRYSRRLTLVGSFWVGYLILALIGVYMLVDLLSRVFA